MKKQLQFYAVLVFCFVCVIASAQQKQRKALFIGIDGVRSDALIAANTPNIDALTSEGIYTYDSWHLGVTSSGPSWSSMMTGVWEQKHLVTNNSYSGANFAQYPYISNRLKEAKPDLKCVQVYTWNPQGEAGVNSGGNVYNSNWDATIDAGDLGQGLVKSTAILQLLDPELDFLFIHFDETDAAGHGFGFSPNVPQYINAIEGADAEIGEVIQALRNRPTYEQEEWLIISTTDHGGQGTGHGGNSNNERKIWWYASNALIPNQQLQSVGDPGSYQMPGNPVDPNLLAQVPVLTDIAVTVLDWMLTDMTPDEIIDMWDLDGKSWLPEHLSTNTGTNNVRVELPGFKVFPNPATDFVSVQFDALDNDAIVSVKNMLGKTVLTREVQGGLQVDLDFDVSTLSSGQYFVDVTEIGGSNQFVVKKLVIE